MLAVEPFLHGIKSLAHHTLFESDTGHRAPSLRFDEYLSFLVLVRSDLASEIVVGAEIPFPVPSVLLHGFDHIVDQARCT